MTRSYNIRFNKKLFRQHVVNGWRNWAIGCVVSWSVAGLGFWLVMAKDWHIAYFTVPGLERFS